MFHFMFFRDETQVQVPSTEAAVAVDEKLDVKTALRRALKSAIVMDGVAKGLHEAAKALDKYNFETILNTSYYFVINSLYLIH